MNVSRRWLEGFLRQPLDAGDVADRLGMLGAPVDAIEKIGANLDSFVVGLVRTVEPHPDADKLRVTTVDDGSGTLHTVVCGAPNVTAGVKYPFARIGTTMPGGLVIERRKIRGQVSEGMLCSARELGLGQDHDGILELSTDAEPGTPLAQVIDAGDERLVVDVTPNRPDLLGHKGVARELAASYRIPFRLPQIPGAVDVDLPTPRRHGDEATVGGIRIAIVDRAGCGRFLAAVVRGVKIGPSPGWLRERLASVGVRSINNVVDVTNYVMFELNQPMHAYDATTLAGGALIVREARKGGEKLVTLDGVERNVPAGSLLIADAELAIGIAGVMGGAATEVSERTTDVLLECAWFDPTRVRAARRAVGLSTDASYRFERGTDRWGAVDAFRRALQLLVTVAGGSVDGETVDLFPAVVHPPRIFLRPSRVTQVLGVELPWTEIERCLVAIGSTVVSKPDDGRIAVDVPGWRPDLQSEIDLVEEVARIHGYDEFPADLRPFRPGKRGDDAEWTAIARMRSGMISMGLAEVMTLEMRSRGEHSPRIANPLSRDHGMLRDAILPSLVEEVENNWAVHNRDVRLFEVGRVFETRGPSERPHEELRTAFVITGSRHPAHWQDGPVAPSDAWDARWRFEQMVALANPTASVQVEGDRWVAVASDGSHIGWCGELDPDAPAWADPLYGGEVRVDVSARAPAVKFRPLPEHPAIARDLALLVGTAAPMAPVVDLLTTRGARLGVESVRIISEFRGGDLPAGRRSVAVRLMFRAADRTLTDSEVEKAVGRLVQMLERELDVTLRSS
jgi:phenylalanyl-tRNA synthetase beta chain